MHVATYDCKRSESESESGNQLSGMLRKASKQTCVLVCQCMYMCMYMCMRRESESASHSPPPQLQGVRVISACARTRACSSTGSLISLLYLFVCRCTPRHKKTHTHTQATQKTQAHTCQVMIENQHVHSSAVSQYSVTNNTHTHSSDESPSKTPDGRVDNWFLCK